MKSVPPDNYWFRNIRIIFICLLSFTSLFAFAQIPQERIIKISPLLQKQWLQKDPKQVATFVIVVKDKDAFKKNIGSNSSIQLVYEYASVNILVIKTSWGEMLNSILPLTEVTFIDEQRVAKEELAVSNLDLSANKVNLVHSMFPQYNGTGFTVSVKENRPDTNDIDFTGRYLSTNLSSSIFSTHASTMMTIIGGAGNTYYEGKGVATGSTLSSSSFAVLLPEADAAYQQYNITVQNHSYGTGIENFYGADAMAYDASVITRPSLMHIFSAGNSGMQTSTTGAYAGVQGFANITGSFKMAKNILTVGHIDSFGVVLAPSSKGPAYDGRIKPEIVAFAEDGSSGAAALVSGISLVLQQAYKDLHGNIPSSALIKAVILNSADDAGTKGIDYTSGFGSANAYKALLGILNARHFNGSINNGGTDAFTISVPSGIKQLKVTLVWNDPPATPNAAKALTNDLDLELSLPANNQLWQPWVLNPFPHVDSLQLLPIRKRDSLNNIEQITLDNPVAGNYFINVKGYNIPTALQSYFIAYQFDSLDRFSWFYPTRLDNIFGGRSNVLRWESTYNNASGQLEYSINNGNTWQAIDNAADLTKGYYNWTPPDTFTTALLRMNFSSQNFRSDTFTVSKRFDVKVGFNCIDSFLLFWNKIPGVSNYQVYRLGTKYMEPLTVINDTAIILGKQTNASLYYAIAPLINGKTGVRSFGFNYTTQGTGCYIKTFYPLLVNNTVLLTLELGTIYNIKNITWEKQTLNGFVPLQTISNITGLQYSYTDNLPNPGVNNYRVKIELLNGQIIYSQSEKIFYFDKSSYIVFPNPALQYQTITILSNDPDNTL
ncbi:MAG: S8 family serine peptidase, partial [Bacteroidia bacterium]|nr:S8 family serine peptidase [Bacteroidia bacterium]